MNIFTDQARDYIASYITSQANQDRLQINEALFRILEGELTSQLCAKIEKDLGTTSAAAAKERQAPINYYRKVIDKLSSIYQQGVIRKVINGTDEDQELVDWYVRQFQMNMKMNVNNEKFNAYKYSLLFTTLTEPDANGTRKPFIRTIPNHEFLILNKDPVDPSSADIVIVCMGERVNASEETEKIYYVYTDEQFMIINEKGAVLTDLMAAKGIEDGVNPYGTIPFVYTNNSQDLAMPLVQIDDLQMALLIPAQLTDLNYSVKFQAFSMFIAIDVDTKNITISPNSILNLKSDPEKEKPSFDSIKPTVDITEVLNLNSSQVSLWLTSKGLRPGAVGDMSGDQFASGISKLIDEADTYESRVKQIEIYKATEREFWDKQLFILHPQYVISGLIENRHIFSSEAFVETLFPKPKPMISTMDLLNQMREEIDMKIESRRGALKRLYPEWSDDEIDDKLAEVDAENVFKNMFQVEEESEEEVEEEENDS